MDVGYVRIDAKKKSTNEQVVALNAAGCERVIVESLSNDLCTSDLIKKPQRVGEQLSLCLDSLSAGDRLVVWELRQIGLSIRAMVHLLNRLRDAGIFFLSIDDQVDTSCQSEGGSRLTSAFEKLDTTLASERSARSIAIAKLKGRLNGRSLKAGPESIEVARVLINSGVSVRDAAKQTSVSQATLYRRVGAKS